MVDIETIDKIADGIYRRYFGDDVIDSVHGENIVDSVGEEAIRVTVMVKPSTVDRLLNGELGYAALDLQDELTAVGEGRFAYVSFGEIGEIFEEEDDVEDDKEMNGHGRS